MPNDAHEEFTEDMAFPIQDLSRASPRSLMDSQFSYCMADIDSLSDKLGIPWERAKDVPFSSSIPYIGFLWDITTVRIAHAVASETS